VADTASTWLKVPEAAERARVGTRTIYNEIAANRLRAARVGGKRSYRLLASWVDTWLEETTTPKEVR
jgi:excisionase family DNA binding protein